MYKRFAYYYCQQLDLYKYIQSPMNFLWDIPTPRASPRTLSTSVENTNKPESAAKHYIV